MKKHVFLFLCVVGSLTEHSSLELVNTPTLRATLSNIVSIAARLQFVDLTPAELSLAVRAPFA